tara:strand:+ start:33 stop:1007 length:975 start_codon:yes stop_codon:yes gene_type:complete
MNVAILGAGSWASALSVVLSENDHNISIYHYNDTLKNQKKYKYLKNIKVPKNVVFKSNFDDISFNDMMLIALPTQFISKTLNKIDINKKTLVVNCSKGFNVENDDRLSLMITKQLNLSMDNFVVLSGPSHAEEVSKKIPTAIVSSSYSEKKSILVQKTLSNKYFRVYTNSDVIGVEIGGACKNIIAIAAGICIGLGYGDNTVSALLSRGLQEIIRLGKKIGAEQQTFYGLSGLGDLSVTIFSKFSRNREFGVKIGKGIELEKAKKQIKMTIEGINATQIVYNLSNKHKINMPIVNEVYSILFNQKEPKLAINELMARKLTNELI